MACGHRTKKWLRWCGGILGWRCLTCGHQEFPTWATPDPEPKKNDGWVVLRTFHDPGLLRR